MAERDLIQKDLVNDLGLSTNTISKLYRNSFKRVDRATLEALMNYFGCPLEGADGLFTTVEQDE